MTGRRNHNQRGKPSYNMREDLYWRKGKAISFNIVTGEKREIPVVVALSKSRPWRNKTLGGDINISIQLD